MIFFSESKVYPLTEAPGDPKLDPSETPPVKAPAAKPAAAKPDTASPKATADEPPDDMGAPAAKPPANKGDDSTDDDPAAAAAGDDLYDDDTDNEPSDTSPEAASADAITQQLQRERLYDSIVDMQLQCVSLQTTIDTVLNRIKNKVAQEQLLRAKELNTTVTSNCDTLRTHFADLGYERVRSVYVTVRERVSAVAEIVKHVIDGDDDFRNPDSGQ